MKMKKIICLALTIALASAITGCSNAESNNTSTNANSTSASEKTDNTSDKKSDDKSDKKSDSKTDVKAEADNKGEKDSPSPELNRIDKSESISITDGKKGIVAEAAPKRSADAADSPVDSSADIITDRSAYASEDADGDTASEFSGDIVPVKPGETAPSSDSMPIEPEPEPEPVEPPTVTQLPEAGQLTAAEWNDNDNWGFFVNLVTSGIISFPSYGIDPRYRVKITVKNDKGEPVANAKAELFDENDQSNKPIWTSVTDHNGVAYLFAQSETQTLSALVTNGDSSEIIEAFKIMKDTSFDQSIMTTTVKEFEVTIGGESKRYKKTDIMFILDTTGSMSDEMMFLQSEFGAIAKETGTDNTRFSVNFYRDEGDDYVTKCFDFTDDISALQSKLNAETADGGGDLPEAVAEILDKSINESKWDDESVKLAFLIFDAPPHDKKEQMLESAIEKASKKGIRLIPVVSSNSDRDTELFGRAIAIKTGGTYVFLTDDSGIGDSHLEPIIGEYKVEKLYDIIIRLINTYRQ